MIMIKGETFVFSGLQPWDIPIGSNARDIAIEVSKHNKVLYVNPSVSIGSFVKNGFRSFSKIFKSNVREINPNLIIIDCPYPILPINWIPDGRMFDLFNWINNMIHFRFVNNVVKRMGINDIILFIDNDIYKSYYAKDFLKPKFTIYYRRDNMVSAYWKKHAPRLEPLLCKKADIVVANSLQLAEAVCQYNFRAFDVGQGVDLSNYSAEKLYSTPSDVIKIKKPIIGYVGWITSRRLDADLIIEIARLCPDYSFVMVGKEDDYFISHQLHNIPNVYFLGEKKVSEVVLYMASFDVCMNPQKINEITIGNYPRKIDEYLALGKPVVATRTRTMEIFNDYVWNCIGAKEYVDAINEALVRNTPEIIAKRVEFAHSHTWESSVKKIYSHINI